MLDSFNVCFACSFNSAGNHAWNCPNNPNKIHSNATPIIKMSHEFHYLIVNPDEDHRFVWACQFCGRIHSKTDIACECLVQQ